MTYSSPPEEIIATSCLERRDYFETECWTRYEAKREEAFKSRSEFRRLRISTVGITSRNEPPAINIPIPCESILPRFRSHVK
jgi:hypothetical protein